MDNTEQTPNEETAAVLALQRQLAIARSRVADLSAGMKAAAAVTTIMQRALKSARLRMAFAGTAAEVSYEPIPGKMFPDWRRQMAEVDHALRMMPAGIEEHLQLLESYKAVFQALSEMLGDKASGAAAMIINRDVDSGAVWIAIGDESYTGNSLAAVLTAAHNDRRVKR